MFQSLKFIIHHSHSSFSGGGDARHGDDARRDGDGGDELEQQLIEDSLKLLALKVEQQCEGLPNQQPFARN